MHAGHGPPAVNLPSSDSFTSHARHRVASPTGDHSPAFRTNSAPPVYKHHRAGTVRVRSTRRFWTYLSLVAGALLLLVPGYLYLHTSLLRDRASSEGAAAGSKSGKGAARVDGGKRRIATLEETRIHDVSWAHYSARRRHELTAASAAERQEQDADRGGGVQQGSSSIASSIAGLGAQLPPYSHYLARAKAGPFPIKLRYPVLWAGALFSKSGYGTEAVSYVASLLQLGLVAPEDVWLSQAGDHMHDEVLRTMDPGMLALFQEHHYHNMTANLPSKEANRPVIAVCHTFPDCWRTPTDDDPRMTMGKVVRGLQNFMKYKVLGKTFRDDGCPCPHADIQDQVVYRVGRTMFETEHVPGPVAAYAQHVDEVWVPSEFNRHSFASSGVDLPKLHTLAQGINTTLFSPVLQPPLDLALLRGTLVAGRPAGASSAAQGGAQQQGQQQQHEASPRRANRGRDVLDTMFNVQPDDDDSGAAGGGRGRPGGAFRFLSVFKWEMRKGWDILLRAYVEEFRGDPDVELHIVTKPFFEKVKDFPSYFRRQVGPFLNITKPGEWDDLPRVYLYHQHVPEALYPRVYASMDALVIPTRGEGWGRPQIEAMAMGLPVISTNWSGLTAFLDDKVAFPIRVEGVVPVQDRGPNSFEWFQGQRWAQPDAKHLRQLMRSVYTERGHAARKGALARAKVLREFSDKVVAHQLLAQILRVQDVVDQLLWGQLQQQQQQGEGGDAAAAAAAGQQRSKQHEDGALGGGAGGGGFWGQRQAASDAEKRRQNRQLQGDEEAAVGGAVAEQRAGQVASGEGKEDAGRKGQAGGRRIRRPQGGGVVGAIRGALTALLTRSSSTSSSAESAAAAATADEAASLIQQQRRQEQGLRRGTAAAAA